MFLILQYAREYRGRSAVSDFVLSVRLRHGTSVPTVLLLFSIIDARRGGEYESNGAYLCRTRAWGIAQMFAELMPVKAFSGIPLFPSLSFFGPIVVVGARTPSAPAT